MKTIRVAAGAAALLVTATFGAAGCSDAESPDDPTTTAAAEPWDPCSLPDEALMKATLDPATEGPGLAANAPGEKSCSWKGDDIAVLATTTASATLDQLRSGPGNIDFQEVKVADRPAMTFRKDGDEDGTFCYLAVPIQSGGVVLVQSAGSALSKDTTPMCDWALRVGNALAVHMPN